MSTHEHKKAAPKSVTIGIITVSTTRALAEDKSGLWMNEQAQKRGHKIVSHEVIPDDAERTWNRSFDHFAKLVNEGKV